MEWVIKACETGYSWRARTLSEFQLITERLFLLGIPFTAEVEA